MIWSWQLVSKVIDKYLNTKIRHTQRQGQEKTSQKKVAMYKGLREACLPGNGWISRKFPNGLFPQTGCAGTKFAMKFFRSEMTTLPPPFGNFPEIHPLSYRQASLNALSSTTNRLCCRHCSAQQLFCCPFLLISLKILYIHKIEEKVQDHQK